MSITYKPVEPVEVGVGETLQEAPYMCHECSEKPMMALPKELQTVESQVATACILMAIAMESTENENERLKAENAKLRELVRDYHRFADEMCCQQECDTCKLRDDGACERGVLTSCMCVLGVEVDE